MADVALYFDGSGFGGTAGSEDDWAAVATWQAGLNADQYPTLGHLINNGWEDDLPALETDIEGALKDNPPPEGAKSSLEGFLSVLKDRAEGDSAVAITLNEGDGPDIIANEPVEDVTLDDPSVSNTRKPSRILDISPDKACQILKDGTVRGKELTTRQRGLFGVICGRRGKKPTGNSVEVLDTEELDYALAVDELSLMAQDGELPAEEFTSNEIGGDNLGDVAVNLMDPIPQMEPYGTPTMYSISPSAYTTGVKGADEASGKARVDSHLALDKAGHRAAAKSHLKAAMAHLDGAHNVVAGSGGMSMPQLHAHLDAARQHLSAARMHASNYGPDQSI
jgi:hypothetical protein